MQTSRTWHKLLGIDGRAAPVVPVAAAAVPAVPNPAPATDDRERGAKRPRPSGGSSFLSWFITESRAKTTNEVILIDD